MQAHEKFKFSIQLTLPAVLNHSVHAFVQSTPHSFRIQNNIVVSLSHMSIIECYAIENKLRKVYTVYVSQNNQQSHWLCDFRVHIFFFLFLLF